MTFLAHDDRDSNLDVPVEIVFAQYQAVDGIQTPFQVTRLLSASPIYQITISAVSFNGQGSPVQHP